MATSESAMASAAVFISAHLVRLDRLSAGPVASLGPTWPLRLSEPARRLATLADEPAAAAHHGELAAVGADVLDFVGRRRRRRAARRGQEDEVVRCGAARKALGDEPRGWDRRRLPAALALGR